MTDSERQGRFRVLETLVSEGGRVEERALDGVLGREVLLVRRGLAVQGTGERGLREARALAGLAHPGLQKLYDAFSDDGGVTLVLEPVGGESLAERLGGGGRLEPEEVRRLGLDLADALAAVHAAGAVHRDVCAEHVILRPEGGVCLTGFRLAKPATQGAQTSLDYGGRETSRVRAELPAHPAPEQLGGEAASPRSDLFALGCLLYRALTGEDAQPELLERGWQTPLDPHRLVPAAPRELTRLILSCLARSPLGRPRSAVELRDALGPAGKHVPKALRRGRRPTALGIAAAAALLVAMGLGAVLLRPDGAGQAASGAAIERGIGLEPDPLRARGGAYGPGFRRSHALLIGIGQEYRRGGFATLPNAPRDVLALAEILAASPGRWETRVLLEESATFDGIRTALAGLEAELDPEDRVLVYFAGHGMPHARSGTSGWLIPADAQSLERDPTRSRWLHFDTFERFLKDAAAKHVLLAMDCCYGGRLAATRSAGATPFEARFLTRPAKVVLAAGRADEPVLDGVAQGHSPFAEVFLGALRERSAPITSSMLHAALLRSFADRDVPHTPVLAFLPEVGPGEFVFLAD